jgi:hypothetical protein
MRAFPMILIAVVLYNLVAFGGGMAAGGDVQSVLDKNFTIAMFSGDHWKVTMGDLILVAALALLFVEVIKAARSSSREILNHAFSMVTFVVALVEFIVLKGFSTSTFFLITAMCLFDVVAGYTISIVAARRDLGVMPAGHDDR